MGKQNNTFQSLQIRDERIVLHSEEDIDMLFQELEKRRLKIANNFEIRLNYILMCTTKIYSLWHKINTSAQKMQ